MIRLHVINDSGYLMSYIVLNLESAIKFVKDHPNFVILDSEEIFTGVGV